MRWNRRYGLKSYARSALWIVPFVAIPIELVVSRIAHWLDPRLGWTLLGYTQQGAQALLEALVTMTLSFVVFTVTNTHNNTHDDATHTFHSRVHSRNT